MANDHGLDYDVIRKALAYDYPRAKDMPGAGFAAGPCLFKDTMQLAAFTDNSFVLGHSAMLVNEGLPLYLVSRLEKKYRPGEPHRRHPRDGVQGRERRHPLEPVLQAQAHPPVPGRARCCAPTRTSRSTTRCCRSTRSSSESDLLVIGAPHRQYQNLSASVEVVDVWNLLGKGTTV